MDVWGLTGNIACGKSAVEEMLRSAGVSVIDADAVAREVVEPPEPALAEIAEAFGADVLDDDGRLVRSRLGAIVFSDPEARKRLEAMTHPRIFARTAQKITALAARGETVAVVSAALMVESGSWRNYAGLAVVTCTEEQQLERLVARDGSSEEDALARITSQLPQASKAALADFVVDNSGSLAETREQVDLLLTRLRDTVPM